MGARFELLCFVLILLAYHSCATITLTGERYVKDNGSIVLTCNVTTEQAFNYLSWRKTSFGSTVEEIYYVIRTLNCGNFTTRPVDFECSCVSNFVFQCVLSPVSMVFNYNIFKCSNSISGLSTSNGLNITVLAPVTPVKLQPEIINASVLEYHTAQFNCTAAGRPGPVIHWYMGSDSEEMKNNLNISLNSSNAIYYCIIDNQPFSCSESTLQYVPNPRDHGKRIYCTATNGFDGNISDLKPVLNVLVRPTKPIVYYLGNTFTNSSIIAVRNQSLDVFGNSTGNPMPTIYWSNLSKFEHAENTLRIHSIQSSDEGTYHCTAKSFLNTSFGFQTNATSSTLFDIIVHYPPDLPRCIIGDQVISNRTIQAIINKPLIINCTSHSKPEPSVYWWELPNGTNVTSNTLSLQCLQNYTTHIYKVNVMNTMQPTNMETVLGFNRTSIEIDILYPPSTPKMYYGVHGPEIISTSIAVIRGNRVIVSCNATSNPPANITWTADNTHNPVLNDTINSDNSRTCTAITLLNPTGSPSENATAEVTVTFEALYPPDLPRCIIGDHVISNRTIQAIINKPLRINCTSHSKPEPSNFWWTLPNGTNVTSNILSLQSLQNDANNIYKLNVMNEMQPTHMETVVGINSIVIDIDILYPPSTPKMYYGVHGPEIISTSIAVIRGNRVIVSCNATSNPPANITWTADTMHNPVLNDTIDNDHSRTCTAITLLTPTGTPSESKTAKVTVTFEALYPPLEPSLKIISCTNGSHIIQNDKIKVVKGIPLQVECSAVGKPSPTYTWLPYSGSANGTVMLHELQQTENIQYTCLANNTMNPTFDETITASNSSRFSLEILEPPSVVCSDSVIAVLHDNFTINCKTIYGNPTTTAYQWTKRNSSEVLSKYEQLHIPYIQLSQEGFYTFTVSNNMEPTGCEAETGIDRNDIYIDIQYEANITSFNMPGRHDTISPLEINQFDTFIIHCDVISDPNATIQIIHESNASVCNMTTAGQKIECRKERATCENDMGMYSCLSWNKYNIGAKSANLTLNILCSPRVSPVKPPNKNITRSFNETASFSLNIIAFPQPKRSEYVWEKQIQLGEWTVLSNTTRVRIDVLIEHQQTDLTINNLEEEDFGEYRVNVSNNVSRNGEGILSEKFYLIASTKPDAPLNVRVLNESITTHSFTIAWEPGFHGGHPQHFIVMYKEQIEPDWHHIQVNTSPVVYVANVTDLKAGTMYAIKMFAVNIIGKSEDTETIRIWTSVAVTNEIKPNSSVVGGAVGGTIGACVIVLSVVAGYKFRRRLGIFKDGTDSNAKARYSKRLISSSRKSHSYVNHIFAPNMETKPDNEQTDIETVKCVVLSESKTCVDDNDDIGATYKNVTDFKRNEQIIPISQLRNEVNRYRTDSTLVFNEYQTLLRGLKNATEAAMTIRNVSKNRYKNIYPYDFNRVKLPTKGSEDDDFINASYINGYESPRRYIATQGPLAGTVEDFWRMVIAERVLVIIMLTNLIEETKVKCSKYWHDDVGSYGEFSIATVKCTQYGNFVVRHLSCVAHGSTTRHYVTQYHFTAWPDKDVPDTALSLTQFWEHVRRNETTEDHPWIVHCSAGVGRTGTFIALDFLYDQGQAEGVVDVFDAVQNLREQRISMVQTKEQYLYLNETLCEALLPIGTVCTIEEFHATMSSAQRTHLLHEEFREICDETVPTVNDGKYRPKLHSVIAGRSDSIEAVFISTYQKKNALILSQYPRGDTMIDFIRLVIDYQVKTICTMGEDIQQEQKLCGKEGTQLEIGPFTVKTISKQKSTNYSQTKLTCTCTNTAYVQDITVYEFTAWPSKSRLSDKDSFIGLLNELNNICLEGPVIVQCRDGHTRSGLFAVLLSVIERIKVDKEVAIAQEVRMMRCRLPKVIVDATQYIFCHDVVLNYVENCMVYENV